MPLQLLNLLSESLQPHYLPIFVSYFSIQLSYCTLHLLFIGLHLPDHYLILLYLLLPHFEDQVIPFNLLVFDFDMMFHLVFLVLVPLDVFFVVPLYQLVKLDDLLLLLIDHGLNLGQLLLCEVVLVS